MPVTRPAPTNQPDTNHYRWNTCSFYSPDAHPTARQSPLPGSPHRTAPPRRAASSAPHRPSHPLAGPAPLSSAEAGGSPRGPSPRPLPSPLSPAQGDMSRCARPSGRRIPARPEGAERGESRPPHLPWQRVCPRRVPRGQARSSAATPWGTAAPASRDGTRGDGTRGDGTGGQPSPRPPSAGHCCPAGGAQEEEAAEAEEARRRPPGPQPASDPMARPRRAHGGAGRGGRCRAAIGRGAGTAP